MAKAASDPVADLLAKANKKYNLSVGTMSSVAEDVEFITTGNIAIDYALGGGIPMGRSLEMAGFPSSGKTTTSLQAAVALQKIILAGGDPKRGIGPNDRMLFLDYEQAMDPEYAEALGLDVNHESFLFTQPDTLEDGANFILDIVKTGRLRLIIIDSVAAMNPSAKAEAEIGKSLPAVAAKLLKDFGVTLNSVLANNNCSCIFLNHTQEKFDMGGGRRPGMPPPTTTPGGMALKYFASVRMEYKQIRNHKGPVMDPLSNEVIEIPVATDVRVKVIKNKVAPPFKEAVVRVRYGKGFDNFWTALQILIANKKIMYSTGYYYFHNASEDGLAPEWMDRAATGTQRPFIRGEDSVFSAGDEHPEWRQKAIELAEKIVAENVNSMARVVPVKPESEEDPLDDEIESTSAGHRVSVE